MDNTLSAGVPAFVCVCVCVRVCVCVCEFFFDRQARGCVCV